MRRVVIDARALKRLADRDHGYPVVRGAVDAGELEILFTRVTVGELAGTPNLQLRGDLLLCLTDLGRLTPTGTSSPGLSPPEYNPATGRTELRIPVAAARLRKERIRVLVSTAASEGAVLVTDAPLLADHAREHNVEVLTPGELLAELGYEQPVSTGRRRRPDQSPGVPVQFERSYDRRGLVHAYLNALSAPPPATGTQSARDSKIEKGSRSDLRNPLSPAQTRWAILGSNQ
jgi:hypothetical protein